VADDTLEKLFIIVDEKGRWDSNETLKFKFTQSYCIWEKEHLYRGI
jgi:hypothetical protein